MAPPQTSHSPRSAPQGTGLGTTAKLHFGSRPARILVAHFDDSMRALHRRLDSLGTHLHTLNTGRDIVAVARAQTPDLILLDLAIPDVNGIDVLRVLKMDPATHVIPVIAVNAVDEVDLRVQSLEEGAADCVTRPINLADMLARIRVVLRMKEREDLLKRRVSFLEELAASDPLTSLLNRRAFDDRLHLEMERAARSGHPLSCLILDIDWFKSINDRYGHQVGDDVLRQVAKVMVEGRREEDAACRYGGEEFVWLLPGLDRDGVLERAEWLRRMIEEAEIPTAEGSFHITISIGASTYLLREHGRVSADLMIEQADAALLEAKKQGKNRVAFREPSSLEDLDDAVSGQPPGGDSLTPWGTATDARDVRASWETALDADPWDARGRLARMREEMRHLLLSSVKVLNSALEAKDPETMTHCQRVASTAVAMAMELDLPAHEVERVRLASLLHDLGKLAVPEAILQKPGPLTPEEWKIVRKHPERGAAMLQDAKAFSHLVDLILYHQESFDGTGYPDALTGRDIPLGARIIRVADAFDALTSNRPYRPRKTIEEAKIELQGMAGTALDPAIVDSLLRLLATMPPVDMQLAMWRDGGLLAGPEGAQDASDESPRGDGTPPTHGLL